jgi:hypothetical protein
MAYASLPAALIIAVGDLHGAFMAGHLRMTFQLLSNEVYSGESLMVRTSLTNRGDDLEVLEGETLCSPFHYQLIDASSGELKREMSQQGYRLLVSKGGELPTGGETRSIDKGEDLSLKEDLAKYALNDFEPGSYQVVALYGEGEGALVSEPQILQVNPLKSEPSVCTYCPTQAHFVDVIAQCPSAGSSLFQRDGAAEDPSDGALMRRIEGLPHRVDSISLAVHASVGGAGRWVGWIAGGAFNAFRGSGTLVVETVEPFALNGMDVTLLDVGFQLTEDNALFFATDRLSGDFLQFFIEKGQVQVTKHASPWKAVPKHVLVQGRYAENLESVELIWNHCSDGMTSIWRSSFSPRQAGISWSPERVQRESAPLADVQLMPLVSERDLFHVNCLWGPDGDQHLMTYCRTRFDDAGPKEEKNFFFAPIPAPTTWAISDDPMNRLMVLAADKEALYWKSVADDTPLTVLMEAKGISNITLHCAPSGGYWARWHQPGCGYCYRFLSTHIE